MSEDKYHCPKSDDGCHCSDFFWDKDDEPWNHECCHCGAYNGNSEYEERPAC